MNKQLLVVRGLHVLVVLAGIGLLVGLYVALFEACFMTVIVFVLTTIVLLISWRSNPVRAWKYSLLVTTLAVVIFVGYCAYDASPNRLFKRFVAADIPASVQILDGKYYSELDPRAFLHFRIDKQDFDKLLATRKYTLKGTYVPPAGDEPTTMPSPRFQSFGMTAQWWRPEDLHEPTLYTNSGPDDPAPNPLVDIWVNGERTEVYFAIAYS